MKTIKILMMVVFVMFLSCTQKSELTDADKKQVEKEILAMTDSVFPAEVPLNAEHLFKYYLQTDELVVAAQGQLITNPAAVLDTIKLHMSFIQKELIKTVSNKVYVISKEAAVISTSRIVIVTFKSGAEITMPLALTMLWVKREGEWKIAHLHN